MAVNRVLLKTNHIANAAFLLLNTIHYLGNLVLVVRLQCTGMVGPRRAVRGHTLLMNE